MNDLIEALQIFAKYTNTDYPTHCEHDVLLIMEVDQNDVSETDIQRLYQLDFHWSEEYECYASFRFGSA